MAVVNSYTLLACDESKPTTHFKQKSLKASYELLLQITLKKMISLRYT